MASSGRPPIFSETMKQTAVYLPQEMIDWLKNQPGTASENVRRMIAKEMKMNETGDRMSLNDRRDYIIDHVGADDWDHVIKNFGGLSYHSVLNLLDDMFPTEDNDALTAMIVEAVN